ncbi:MAG: ribonuclease Y [Planctomycetia bacterium]|nr:ribonuclease Y [Planctomycetia bacterium]
MDWVSVGVGAAAGATAAAAALRWLLRPVVPAADAAKERELERREADLAAARDRLARATADAEAARREADAAGAEARARLAEAAGFSPAEAKAKALEVLDRELAAEHARRVAAHVEAVRTDAEARARALVATAIQRVAVSHAAERTVTSVPLPDDGMKGRVIGREGRNARAFEHATGCDVVVDDTPGLVTISGFDPVRREVARRAMSALVADGRIHPVRIEEAVAEARRALEEELVEAGRKALAAADVGDAHPRVVGLLGRLQYRTSYGQNVLQHALEVAHLCGAMASELGLDPRIARRAGLLHDLGKAVDHEVEGGHAAVGADVARKCGESPVIVNAIASHHEDVPQESPYAVLAQVGDAVSAARPGARADTADRYLKRLGDLERVATAFPGVVDAYAVSAGREVRVIVDARTVADAAALVLARDIAKAVEGQLTYPGEIKVTVVRETRAVSFAR